MGVLELIEQFEIDYYPLSYEKKTLLSEYPELEFVEWNCLPLTNKKHNTFHDRVNDRVINQGLYWQKKRKKEFLNFFKNEK
ncbi:bacteriophage nuclease [Streptococcus pneumoniae]|nr:bacteriophage nuclease [Streptococcus pneumoniae]VQD40877.1 bacteriophage nuclease [Streptococcus pneumoniae]VSV61891.1 bacteriophage nuclease [Streptococcus pneumoniae]